MESDTTAIMEEEMMALEAIYYDSFGRIGDNRFRVRVDLSGDDGVDSGPPPLFLEVLLPQDYPEAVPQFDVSNINNSNYSEFAKRAIIQGLNEQASGQRGESMCYNLVEWLKDKLPEFYSLKAAAIHLDEEDLESTHPSQGDGKDSNSAKNGAKEKLTKAQKRRFFDKFGATAEKPRGWNWVPIISHLSQVPQHGPLTS